MKLSRNLRSLAPLAVGLCALGMTVPASAQSAYYDPVRDVMVPVIERPSSPYGRSVQPAIPEPARPYRNTFQLVVRDGHLVTGPSAISVDHGSDVVLMIESQVPDVFQVEGYGLNVNLPAGQTVVLNFTAEAPGRFQYGLARSGRPLGVLEVGPPAPAGG